MNLGRQRDLQSNIAAIRLACETFSRLLIDIEGPSPQWEALFLRQVGLDCTKKLRKSKLVSSVSLWPLPQFLHSGSCLEVLPWLYWMMDFSG